MIAELKIINENVNKDKEELKKNIPKAFTKIRNHMDNKEDELLLKIDEIYIKSYINDEIVKSGEKLPYKIKISLEKRNKMQKEWNENDLIYYVNICLNIENNIKEINKIKNIIQKYKSSSKTKIKFDINEDKFDALLTSINNFGKIYSEEEDLYKNYDIKLKNPIRILNNHTGIVWCLIFMKDGRLASGSEDQSIIIYNLKTYKPDLTIKEHKGQVYCIVQLSTGILASCSTDKSIKLFNIKGNEYEIIQTINHHTKTVFKILELKNNNLLSCSDDCFITIYSKQNSDYKKDFQISTSKRCSSAIQTKDNEICYSVLDSDDSLYFFDLLERQNKATLTNISKWIIKENGL